ncbi:helix-turn-helix transcriptional regulator [Promicromonospora sukumoe]|uniref:helix-turn-helix transcriptional regulator n=1 Tax=Promicromonospora sukumoe TaxID=88382 RepID=UPI000A06D397|nr:LuxR family transcriptional regulator [Promicromonospora sukumoe]
MDRWRKPSEGRWHTTPLTGRRTECQELDELVNAIKQPGESRVLVIHGEAGVGKSALLDYLAEHAPGCLVVRGAGVQSEVDLAFAGLHQLCSPVLGHLDRLPEPQSEALRTVFGMSAGPPPDRFLVGLAVLGLLSIAAEVRPLVCLVDDLQWLDRETAQVMAFVARRLAAESIALVFATRVTDGGLEHLPSLRLEGLTDAAARRLLGLVLPGPIDEAVLDQIVTETRGNPLALLELPQGLSLAELAGGFGIVGAALDGSIEESFRRRVKAVPRESQTLLLLAAADPTGDSGLVWRAAQRLGIGPDASAPATEAGLAAFGARVLFRHPLARSAAYWSAGPQDRRDAHRALADVTDERTDPDRRAWHRAHGSAGPDAALAAELERSATRAQARGGLGAAAAFLRQAVVLTVDPGERARRGLAAAQVALDAGSFDEARELIDLTGQGRLDDVQRATVDTMRAELSFVTSRGGDAPRLLLDAARRFERVDLDRARTTYADALVAAIFANRLAGPGGTVTEVARAVGSAPTSRHGSGSFDLLINGTARGLCESYAAGVPALRSALATFGSDISSEEEMQLMYLACITAIRLWDDAAWDSLSSRYVELVRTTGALSKLPLALTARAHMLLFAGDLPGAASLIEEQRIVTEATGSGLTPYGAMWLAALRGSRQGAEPLIQATVEDASRRGEGIGVAFAEGASALLNNGLGRFEEAMAAGLRATAYDKDLAALNWVLVELVESALRCGETVIADDACQKIAEMAHATGTDWARGALARTRALVSTGEAADRLYRESLTRLGRTRLRVDLARAHLLYGEWLRRERRRSEAREHLRQASSMFDDMGVAAFAERARRELRAAGGPAPHRDQPGLSQQLTAQEAQIAMLARDGLSNREIATRLFISAHTVQYHLRKVFPKLGITSRSQLDRVVLDTEDLLIGS